MQSPARNGRGFFCIHFLNHSLLPLCALVMLRLRLLLPKGLTNYFHSARLEG